jgi:hypothetical protein
MATAAVDGWFDGGDDFLTGGFWKKTGMVAAAWRGKGG